MMMQNETLLLEYDQHEIDLMSDVEKRLILVDMNEKIEEAEIESQIMKSCPQSIDPINF